jgi:hypothetical protein
MGIESWTSPRPTIWLKLWASLWVCETASSPRPRLNPTPYTLFSMQNRKLCPYLTAINEGLGAVMTWLKPRPYLAAVDRVLTLAMAHRWTVAEPCHLPLKKFRILDVLFGMQIRTLGPYSKAIHRILIPATITLPLSAPLPISQVAAAHWRGIRPQGRTAAAGGLPLPQRSSAAWPPWPQMLPQPACGTTETQWDTMPHTSV